MKHSMKLFAALATVALAAAFTSCGGGIKEQRFMGISDKPKSVKITTYEAVEKFGEVVEEEIEQVQLYEFDSDGRTLKMTVYGYDGDVDFSMTYKYDGDKCVETNSFQSYNEISRKSVLKSSTKNSFVWEMTSSGGTVVTEFVERGNNKMTTVQKDTDGDIISKFEQIYDKNGNVVEIKGYGEDGEVVYRTVSTFDGDSREITRKEWNGVDYESEYLYSYEAEDDKGNWTKRIDRADGELETVTIREIKY